MIYTCVCACILLAVFCGIKSCHSFGFRFGFLCKRLLLVLLEDFQSNKEAHRAQNFKNRRSPSSRTRPNCHLVNPSRCGTAPSSIPPFRELTSAARKKRSLEHKAVAKDDKMPAELRGYVLTQTLKSGARLRTAYNVDACAQALKIMKCITSAL